MTTYYVGIGGNDGSAGTSWALRKLTLNGAEDIPVAAADTIYVGPGTYRELLTCDVSGTAGNPITYIGDYSGVNTDGVGGIVRITGSDNDQTATRANAILVNGFNYRTFSGLALDTTSEVGLSMISATNVIVDGCLIGVPGGNGAGIALDGSGQSAGTIRNCFFFPGGTGYPSLTITWAATLSDTADLVENCVFWGGWQGIMNNRVGGVTVKNSVFIGLRDGIRINNALAGGQALTVNNC